MRIIPKNSKIKTTLYKNITASDIVIAFIALALIAITLSTNFSFKWWIALGELCLVIPFYISVNNERIYQYIGYFIRYLFSNKRYSIGCKNDNKDVQGLIPYKDVKNNLILNKDDTYSAVIEINPVEFHMLSKDKQMAFVDDVFARVLNDLSNFPLITIVKQERPLVLDSNIQDELNRADKLIDSDSFTKEEREPRLNIIESRIELLDSINSDDKQFHSCFYIVVTGRSKDEISISLTDAMRILNDSNIKAKRLEGEELIKFIRYSIDTNFDERDMYEFDESLFPNYIRFGLTCTKYKQYQISHFVINDYPLRVNEAWGEGLFDLENTRVSMRLNPVDQVKAIRRIDTAIFELDSDRISSKASENLDRDEHKESLENLLVDIQSNNEILFDTTIIISVYDEFGKSDNKKKVRTRLREMGFSISEMIGRQCEAFITHEYSLVDKIHQSRGIQSSSVAAVFPFTYKRNIDKNGILIGENRTPVIIDFFKRDQEHVNSNMIVVGQSGMGKSYATKTILSAIATDGAKIFVLDPENEYTNLANNLGGEVIDVSDGSRARINPFQIVEGIDENSKNSYSLHLLFLEQFLRLVMDGLSQDSFELLNKCIEELYEKFNIGKTSDFKTLTNKDYPTFDDLYCLVRKKMKEESDSYDKSCLRVIVNYLSKFRGDGRYSDMWNGPTSFDSKKKFIVFDFQRLLSSPNDKTANAQMLLVLKYLENEVIKNRELNTKNGTHNKIVVAIDEAHLFIDEKYPIALDFMFQLAKRIRKYDGMLLIITQSIKDFAGTGETERKTSAIINVSQYSLIFSLSPNDMTELIKLYENAGQINETEKNAIIHNRRGEAFLISSPNERFNVSIIATDITEKSFN